MFRFAIISVGIVCLSVAAGYSLSVAHAALGISAGLSSVVAVKPRDDQTPKPPLAVQARFITPAPVKVNEGASLIQVELSNEPANSKDDRDPSSKEDRDPTPYFIPRPRSRPDAPRTPRRFNDFGPGQIDLSLTHKPSLIRPSYAPRLRNIPAPAFPRDKARINPIPGYLIGVFR